jgi:nicotinamide-nucleotide amidase
MSSFSEATARNPIRRAHLLIIGDEILRGRTRDANLALCAGILLKHGVPIEGCSVIPDDVKRISSEMDSLFSPDTLLITTGGLGPTDDDMTAQAVADAMGVKLVESESALRMVREHYENRCEPVPDAALAQANLPEGGEPVANPVGVAPGILLTTPGLRVVCLPGVPAEIEAALPRALAELRSRGLIDSSSPGTGDGGGDFSLVRTWGIREVSLYERFSSRARARDCSLAFLPRRGMVDILVRGDDRQGFASAIAGELGAHFYGFDPGLSLFGALGRTLVERSLTLSVAESCTAGMLGSMLTAEPGSSAWFEGGVISYSDRVKEAVLGVAGKSLSTHGAVSRPVVEEMAAGVALLTGSDVAISISGIAGPDGGTAEKPVGTVWMGSVGPGFQVCRRNRFRGDRSAVREAAAVHATGLALSCLEGRSMMLEKLPEEGGR